MNILIFYMQDGDNIYNLQNIVDMQDGKNISNLQNILDMQDGEKFLIFKY